MGPKAREKVIWRLRAICSELPEVEERLSHGAPTFFVRGKRSFLTVHHDHHGDGRFAIWCAAGHEIQRVLVDANPERFFVPAYVGHRGWIGVRLDRDFDWDELTGIVEDAYAKVAPPEARRPGGRAALRDLRAWPPVRMRRNEHTGAPWLRRGRFSG